MKPKLEVLSSVQAVRTNTIKLGRMDIVAILKYYVKKDIPDNARVTFDVPSGGDYSGVRIDLDAENPLYVIWDETVVEDTREDIK